MDARTAVLVLVGVLAIAHQDFWLWDDASLVGGVLPVGLAWHAGFSLVASAIWGLVVVFAWPSDPLGEALVEAAEGEESP